MKRLRRILAAIGLVGVFAGVANADIQDDRAVVDYDRFCIQGVFQHDHLAALMQSLKAKALPPIAANQFLRQSGQVWVIDDKPAQVGAYPVRITVFLTDTGACGVELNGVDEPTVQAIFEKRIEHRLIERDDDKNQTLTIFAAHAPTADKGTDTRIFALLLVGKHGYDRYSMVLSVIPKVAFDRVGGGWAWPAGF